MIDQFERFGFQHKAQKFLVRFSLRYGGFAVEAIVKEDFVWCQVCETCVTKDQPVVHIPDVANEKVVVGEDLFEVDGPNLFTKTTMRQRAGDRGLPMGLPLLWRIHFWPRANVCMSSAEVIKPGTSLMMILRVKLRPRNVRPLMMSPGLLVSPG